MTVATRCKGQFLDFFDAQYLFGNFVVLSEFDTLSGVGKQVPFFDTFVDEHTKFLEIADRGITL